MSPRLPASLTHQNAETRSTVTILPIPRVIWATERSRLMITAIVLIQAEQGKIPDLAQALLDIPEVAEVYSVAGEFDLVAILRVKEYDAMAEVVPSKLQNLAGVARTTTLMAFQCY